MPRTARKDLNTPFLHVMVQGVNREYIFDSKEQIELYLKIINKNISDYNLIIMAYCMMNNHAHFLIYVENVKELGKFMQKCNLQYAQIYNREKNRVGVLFRNRFQTEPIYNELYLINCIKYIHQNPVRANIVRKCEDYKYSSYNDYKNNVGIAKNKIAKELFGEKCDYITMFQESFYIRQMDIAEERGDIEEYILEGIKGYQKEYSKNLIEILSNKETFQKLIYFLKENCGLKYEEIKKYFEMSRGTMDSLKKY